MAGLITQTIGFAAAIVAVYVLSHLIRGAFELGQGPLIKIRRGALPETRSETFWTIAFRVGGFYGGAMALIVLGGAGVVTFLDGNEIFSQSAILAAAFSVTIARILAIRESGSMLDDLYKLALGVWGGMVYLFVVNPDFVHKLALRVFREHPDNLRLFGFLVVVSAIVGEIAWHWGPRFLPSAKQVPYSLFREYHETNEVYEMAVYRDQVERMFTETVGQSLVDWDLKEFCWKTWSGEPKIATALLDAVCKRIKADKPFDEMSPAERGQHRVKAKEYLYNLAQNGKARIIMPLYPEFPDAVTKVQDILGVTPIQISDVGVRRYLVINGRHAVLSLPLPAESTQAEHGLISETGSNVSIHTSDPSRVNDCLIDFNGLWETFAPKPSKPHYLPFKNSN